LGFGVVWAEFEKLVDFNRRLSLIGGEFGGGCLNFFLKLVVFLF